MKNSEINSGFGISTLVMIFMVLCLSIFATLTYLQANYNYNQSSKIVNSKKEYYDADYKASLIYIDLKEKLASNEISDEYLKEKNIQYVNQTYCYNVDISDSKVLEVILKQDGDDLTIVTWKESTTVSGNYDYQTFVD